MDEKHIRYEIDSFLITMDSAPDTVKTSAKMDSASNGKPYGYIMADWPNDKSHWSSNLQKIITVIEDCQKLPEFSTMTTIEYFDEKGNPDGVNHTSFDGRVELLKEYYNTGRIAGGIITLTVFKDESKSLVETFINQYFVN